MQNFNFPHISSLSVSLVYINRNVFTLKINLYYTIVLLSFYALKGKPYIIFRLFLDVSELFNENISIHFKICVVKILH